MGIKRGIIVFFSLLVGILTGMLFFILNHEFTTIDLCMRYQEARPTYVLDDEGFELCRFEIDHRRYITIDKVPRTIIQAFLAAEDHKFLQHLGISFKGILRSLLVNIYHGKVVQGASTITQQVARLLFLSQERTVLRKIREVFFAFYLERSYSKEQILEFYLNHMYFGRGIYGIEAACQRFWNKSVIQLSIDQAATLAAVAKSARFYSPLNAPDRSEKRRNVVLASMKKLGFITPQDYEFYKKQPLALYESTANHDKFMYVQEWIRVWAEQKWGRDRVYKKGLIIKTTINKEMQAIAERSFDQIIYPLRKQLNCDVNGGVICLEVSSGAIKSLVGGVSFKESQFNRALQAERQLGSSFKPLLYAFALEQGYQLDDIFVDEHLSVPLSKGACWEPKNWNNKFDGPMTLVRALTISNNIVAIKLLMNLDRNAFKAFIERCGFKKEPSQYLSLALGTVEASVLENAASFNIFANNGYYVQPYLIEWVKEQNGKKIWEHESKICKVISSLTAGKMINALSHRMNIAQAQNTHEGIAVASIGKTGSTNEAATTWFVGSTPDFTTAVYVGRDDNKPMGKGVFASKITYPIWVNIHKRLKYTKKYFYIDPSLETVYINWRTGEIVDPPPQTYNNYSRDIVPILKEKMV